MMASELTRHPSILYSYSSGSEEEQEAEAEADRSQPDPAAHGPATVQDLLAALPPAARLAVRPGLAESQRDGRRPEPLVVEEDGASPPAVLVLSGRLAHQEGCLGAYALVDCEGAEARRIAQALAGSSAHGAVAGDAAAGRRPAVGPLRTAGPIRARLAKPSVPWPLWKHTTRDRWIARHSGGNFLVQLEKHVALRDTCFVRLPDADVAFPHLSSLVWQEYSTETREWVQAPLLQCDDEALPESVSPWTPGDSTPGMRPTSTGTGLSWLHAAQEMRPELASNLQLDYREATDLASNLDFAPPPARAKPPLRGRLRPDRSRGRASDSIKRPTLFAPASHQCTALVRAAQEMRWTVTHVDASACDLIWPGGTREHLQRRLAQLSAAQTLAFVPGVRETLDPCVMSRLLVLGQCLFPFFPSCSAFPFPSGSTPGGGGDRGEARCSRCIQEPLLLEEAGLECRVFALVSSVQPLEVWLCSEGVVQHASGTATWESEPLHSAANGLEHEGGRGAVGSMFEAPILAQVGGKKTLSHVMGQLKAMGHEVEDMWRDVQRVVRRTCLLLLPFILASARRLLSDKAKPTVQRALGGQCVHLLGYDVTFDRKGTCHLLGIDGNPDLGTEDGVDVSAKGLAMGALLLVLQARHKKWGRSTIPEGVARRLSSVYDVVVGPGAEETEDDADLRVLMRVHQLYVALGGVQGDIDADRLNTMVSCLGLDTLISSDRVEAAFLCRKLPHSLHRHHVRAHHPDPQCNAKPESAGAEGVGSEPSSPPMPPPAPPLDLEAFIQILLQLGSTAFPEEESTGIRQEPAPLDSLNRLLKHFHDGVVFPAARRAAGKNASRKCAAGTVKGGQTCGQDEVGAGSRGQPPSGEVTRSADAPSGKLQSQQARDAGSAEAVRASKEEEEEEE